MTRTDLLEMITNGENSGVEFEPDVIDTRTLAKELVAFANLEGGHVLLGVDNAGTLVGLSRPNIEEWVMIACRDKIQPEITPHCEVVRDVEPGKDVAVVRVGRGWAVHHVWHDNHRTYYIRVGTESREASREELERLFPQRGAFRLEIRPVSGSSMQDLDYRRLRDYFTRVRQQEAPPDEAGWRTLLVNTEILAEESPPPATVAGLLLFGINPNRYLPQAGIDAAAYSGREKEYAANQRMPLRGPMTPLFSTPKFEENAVLVENGLVEQAVDFVRCNTRVTASLEGGARRTERWDYPEEAVREAVVNALVHRDYLLSSTDIELSIYTNRSASTCSAPMLAVTRGRTATTTCWLLCRTTPRRNGDGAGWRTRPLPGAGRRPMFSSPLAPTLRPAAI